MSSQNGNPIAVIDYRRQTMVLKWHALGGTWTACDEPPPLVHGVALIRAAQPNVCVYGQGGRLFFQVGPNQYALSENSPRIKCSRGLMSFGLRRRFVVESSTAGVLYSHAFWPNLGTDFFRWLAAKAEDPDWRVTSGRRWSDGVAATVLRQG